MRQQRTFYGQDKVTENELDNIAAIANSRTTYEARALAAKSIIVKLHKLEKFNAHMAKRLARTRGTKTGSSRIMGDTFDYNKKFDLKKAPKDQKEAMQRPD